MSPAGPRGRASAARRGRPRRLRRGACRRPRPRARRGASAARRPPVRVGQPASSGRRARPVPASGVTASVGRVGRAAPPLPAAGVGAPRAAASVAGLRRGQLRIRRSGVTCCVPSPGVSVLDTSRSVPRPHRRHCHVSAVGRSARRAGAGSRSPSPSARRRRCCCPPSRGGAAEETAGAAGAPAGDAVEALLAAAPEVGGRRGRRRAGRASGSAPGDVGDLRGFGVDLEVPFAGRAAPGRRGGCRWPHTVGAWLLDEAGHAGARLGVGPGDLPGALAGLPGPVGVLAMGDGSARRTLKAPGYLDPAAEPFDAAVAAALAAGDAAALAGLDPAEGERLLAAGVPTWRAVGAALAGRAAADGAAAPRRRAVRRRLPGRRLVRCRERGPPPRGRRRRADRHRQDGARRRAGPAAGRRGGQRRLDAALPRHGHRHRQAGRRPSAAACRTTCSTSGTCARPASVAGVPAAGPGRDRPAARGRHRPAAGGRLGAVRAGGARRAGVPGHRPGVRARLEEELAAVGAAALHARLAERRPGAAAAAVLPSNGRRIVRALEVVELTGGPFRARAAASRGRTTRRRRRAGPGAGRARRADRRAGSSGCGPRGFVAEVEALAADGLREGPTASRALGLRAGARAARRRAHRRRGARADGDRHPPVRPPAAVLVPPRPGGHLVRRRPPRPARRGRRGDRRPYDRARDDTDAPRADRARHGERLRRAARPRRQRLAGGPADRRSWCAGCATGAAGVGGDGVLRRRPLASTCPTPPAVLGRRPRPAARGSWTTATPTARTAEMCGNGIRLFLHALLARGTARPRRLPRPACSWAPAAARGGWARPRDGRYWVDMGPARPFGRGQGDRRRADVFDGLAVSMGNPHLACLTDVDRRRARPHRARRRSTPSCSRTGSTSSWSTCVGRRGARAHPAARGRARGGGDPLLRHRRLRRRLRRAGRGRAPRPATVVVDVPGGRLSVRGGAGDDGAHRPRRARRRPVRSRRSGWPADRSGTARRRVTVGGSSGGASACAGWVRRRGGVAALAPAAPGASRMSRGGFRPSGSRPGSSVVRVVGAIGPASACAHRVLRCVGGSPSAVHVRQRPGVVRPAPGSSASSSSGRSRMRDQRAGHAPTARPAARPRRRPTASARRRCQLPSAPPSRPPSGIVPKTRKRTEAFIRPSSVGGHSRWRKLTWVTL